MWNFFEKIRIRWYLQIKLNYFFYSKLEENENITRALCGLKLVKNCGPGIRALGASEVVYK